VRGICPAVDCSGLVMMMIKQAVQAYFGIDIRECLEYLFIN
jgi:hypothetical protein